MQPLPRALMESIDALVEGEGSHPISVARTIRQIRAAFPDLPVSDDMLATTIAARAVQSGCGVEFDEVELAMAATGGAPDDRRAEPRSPARHE
jgi:hypothetical protein